MKLHVSHGADPDDPDWFVVHPLEGHTVQSVINTPISHEMAVQSLLDAGRVVYELDLSRLRLAEIKLARKQDTP